MTLSDIQTELCSALKWIQEIGGHREPEIGPETIPLRQFPDFDSLTSVEASSLVADKLQCELKFQGRSVNLFVSEDASRALTVSEIAQRIYLMTSNT